MDLQSPTMRGRDRLGLFGKGYWINAWCLAEGEEGTETEC
jgi:hypothetical protein